MWMAGYHGDHTAVSKCVCLCAGVSVPLFEVAAQTEKTKGGHTHTNLGLVSFRLTESGVTASDRIKAFIMTRCLQTKSLN